MYIYYRCDVFKPETLLCLQKISKTNERAYQNLIRWNSGKWALAGDLKHFCLITKTMDFKVLYSPTSDEDSTTNQPIVTTTSSKPTNTYTTNTPSSVITQPTSSTITTTNDILAPMSYTSSTNTDTQLPSSSPRVDNDASYTNNSQVNTASILADLFGIHEQSTPIIDILAPIDYNNTSKSVPTTDNTIDLSTHVATSALFDISIESHSKHITNHVRFTDPSDLSASSVQSPIISTAPTTSSSPPSSSSPAYLVKESGTRRQYRPALPPPSIRWVPKRVLKEAKVSLVRAERSPISAINKSDLAVTPTSTDITQSPVPHNSDSNIKPVTEITLTPVEGPETELDKTLEELRTKLHLLQQQQQGKA